MRSRDPEECEGWESDKGAVNSLLEAGWDFWVTLHTGQFSICGGEGAADHSQGKKGTRGALSQGTVFCCGSHSFMLLENETVPLKFGKEH